MPGFSDAERERFSHILSSARLTDAWRTLHPPLARTDVGAPSAHRTSASFTWRGARRKEGNPNSALFEGKVRVVETHGGGGEGRG
jgi:hypothetical protein